MAKRIFTKKQGIILMLLYCFRFLNSKQIQEFLGHRDHRRINAWLKDLEEKKYIVRDFNPIFGTLTKPAVCYLTALGRGYVKNNYKYHFPKYLKRIARDNKASKAFRIRCQIIADWYLTLFSPLKRKPEEKELKGKTGIAIVDTIETELTTNRGDKEEKILLNIVQFFTPCYFPSLILLERIKPDGYLRKRTTNGIMHGFLFVLDAYIPRMMLRYLLQRIFTTLDEEYWEEDSIHSLQFYILCPNNMIIIYLKRLLPSFLEQYSGERPLRFHFATRNQLYDKKNGKTENIKWFIFSSNDY